MTFLLRNIKKRLVPCSNSQRANLSTLTLMRFVHLISQEILYCIFSSFTGILLQLLSAVLPILKNEKLCTSKTQSLRFKFPLTEFTPPVWFFCTTSFNHWLLIVNASCNFLIYVSVGDKFKTSIANFCQTKLGCCLQAQASPSESNKSVKSNTVPLMLIAKSDSQEGITAVAVKGPQIQVCTLQPVLPTWLHTLKL